MKRFLKIIKNSGRSDCRKMIFNIQIAPVQIYFVKLNSVIKEAFSMDKLLALTSQNFKKVATSFGAILYFLEVAIITPFKVHF